MKKILSIKSDINFEIYSTKSIYKFRRIVCILLVKHLPSKNLGKIKKLFEKIDYDNSGAITKSEIVN